jgi:Peptidase C13 family
MDELQAPQIATPELTTWQAFVRNLLAGLRVALLMPHWHRDVVATWGQVGLLVVATVVSSVVWGLVDTGWPARFNPSGVPHALFSLPLIILASLTITAMARRSSDTLAMVVVLLAAGLWIDAGASAAKVAARLFGGPNVSFGAEWVVWGAICLWYVACIAVAWIRRFELGWAKRFAAITLATGVVAALVVTADYGSTVWIKVYDEDAARADRANHDVASEEILYLEPKLLADALAAVEPRRAGRPNLYLISVAGYAEQNVFRREVESVDTLFAERFGTRGRSVRLVNSRDTVTTTPLATRTALAQALKRVGGLMDRDQDVLFLFLTSHGSKDGRFLLTFYPLRLSDLTAAELKQMLDESGIRNRVIVVSSCYSGAFVDALKDDDSLIVTASAKDRNSFGCSNEADFTYFGKAYFDEALRTSDSFIDAFDFATPVIAEREKKDNFTTSDPQRYVGANIAAKLSAWRETNALDRAKAQ